MTNLKRAIKKSGLKLREVAAVIKATPQSVFTTAARGIRRVATAKKYASAFPGTSWKDLLD